MSEDVRSGTAVTDNMKLKLFSGRCNFNISLNNYNYFNNH